MKSTPVYQTVSFELMYKNRLMIVNLILNKEKLRILYTRQTPEIYILYIIFNFYYVIFYLKSINVGNKKPKEIVIELFIEN